MKHFFLSPSRLISSKQWGGGTTPVFNSRLADTEVMSQGNIQAVDTPIPISVLEGACPKIAQWPHMKLRCS